MGYPRGDDKPVQREPPGDDSLAEWGDKPVLGHCNLPYGQIKCLYRIIRCTNRQDIRRIHGGAVPRSPAALPYTQREGQDPLAKRRIAAVAAARLVGFRAVCLDAGTSVVEVARLLSVEFKGMLVTVSLPVAAELAERPGTEVVLVGGRVSGYTRATSGPDTIDALRRYRFDACVLGVCSLDPLAGLTVADRDEAFVKAAMVERSTLVVAVAVRGKLGTAEPFVIASASAVGLLVTDAAESDPTVCALVRSGVEVVCVPAE